MGDAVRHDRRLLFEINEPGGKSYRIFTDGWIEGFHSDAWISNWYPARLAEEQLAEKLSLITDPLVANKCQSALDKLDAWAAIPPSAPALVGNALADVRGLGNVEGLAAKDKVSRQEKWWSSGWVSCEGFIKVDVSGGGGGEDDVPDVPDVPLSERGFGS